jgi:hypothetical protein
VLNVTGRPYPVGLPFIKVFTRSTILPGDDNYRYYLNAGIIAVNMNRIAMGEGHRSAAHRPAANSHARGNRR